MQRILIIEVSDTTGIDSSNAAKYIIQILFNLTFKKIYSSFLNNKISNLFRKSITKPRR